MLGRKEEEGGREEERGGREGRRKKANDILTLVLLSVL